MAPQQQNGGIEWSFSAWWDMWLYVCHISHSAESVTISSLVQRTHFNHKSFKFLDTLLYCILSPHFYSCLPGTRVSPHVQSGISCWAAEGSMVSHWCNTGNCGRTTWTCSQWLLLSQREWDQTWLLFIIPKMPRGHRTLPYWKKGFRPLWNPWNSQGLY